MARMENNISGWTTDDVVALLADTFRGMGAYQVETVFEKQNIFNQNVIHTFGYELNLMHGGYSNNLYFVQGGGL